MKRSIKLILFFAMVTFLVQTITAEELVKFDNFDIGEMKYAGFKLDSKQKVKIDAVGLYVKRDWNEFSLGYAWILNSETNEPVWEMEKETGRRLKPVEYEDVIELPKGTYEVYYSTYAVYNYDNVSPSRIIGRFFSWLADDDDDWDGDYYVDRYFDDLKLVIEGKGKKISASELDRQKENKLNKALVYLKADDDDLYLQQGFELKKEMKLEITGQGEGRDDGNFDYGWIYNAETGKRVWKMDYWDGDDAGGAEKNRLINESVTLPAGKYVAVYITDDSHSPAEWNAAPPYNPLFWGMTITAKDGKDSKNFSKFDYKNDDKKNRIVSLTPARDEDYLTKGFKLKKDMKVRVYAIGEGMDRTMYDYGWIIDAKTRERVWEMKYRRTEHAGGATKNRMVNQVIELKKGDYIVSYVTDGSHAYRSWNASRPYDQKHWGISLFATEANFKKSDVAFFDETDDPNTLVSIIRVRDGEYRRKNFKLDKEQKIRIYALGEGTHGEMHDYAWIENAKTGRVVWEMTYRKTERAGGARKNRLFDDYITLDKGEYTVYYETDDSHSFNDWNQRPPHDPTHWGVSLYVGK